MSLNLIQINPLVSPQWDETVLNSSYPQFFHLSCWIKTLAETYNFKPLCFMAPKEHGCTIPMLKVKTFSGRKKAVALPFSDGCDILCNEIGPDELVGKLLTISREEKIDRLEFLGVSRFIPSGEPSHSYYGHRLELTKDEKELWKKLSSSKQRNIKKAQREEVTVAFYNDSESIREFFRLHCITRRRHGLPPQPISFFNAIVNNIVEKGSGEVALANSGGKIIAGALFLFCKSEALYKFGASDKSLQNLRSNDLLMWEAIKRYAQKGYSVLSFGKTEMFHEGLCRFKEGFGALRVTHFDHIYDVSTGKKRIESPYVQGFHNRIFRIMPVALLRLSGELLYKYSA